ncbi:beta-ketoacyl synthase chain length factor [Thalassospira profundimaris]|uniref:beta-ketoacyl synthase chain length factor n=1 Tax=Thalassospira profundimaris TaxID=502049 RepID=UPI000DED50A8|nr:beta-ketoacyl synthase chain length factor [Thalassospira profundimaris]
MQSIPASISRWALWQDHATHPTLRTHLSGGKAAGIDNQDLARSIAPAWRRRLDLFGRASAEVLGQVLDGVSPEDICRCRVIFSSRHGNIERTLKLLGQIAREEIPSPADFSMSVHNALVGVASINWGITQAHSAISAGNDSFIAALTEALCQLADDPHSPVVIIYIDLPLPEVYAQNDPKGMKGTAFALYLEAPEAPNRTLNSSPPIKLEFEPVSVPAKTAPNHNATFPCAHACQMADFLTDLQTGRLNGQEATSLLTGHSFAWNMVHHG